MALLTWEQYSSLHSLIEENEFGKAELLAEKEIRNVIGVIRWNEITSNKYLKKEFYYEQLLDCICNVMDFAVKNKKLGAGISSVSNDGYSVNYAIKTPEELSNELKKNIVKWLSGTGLIGAY